MVFFLISTWFRDIGTSLIAKSDWCKAKNLFYVFYISSFDGKAFAQTLWKSSGLGFLIFSLDQLPWMKFLQYSFILYLENDSCHFVSGICLSDWIMFLILILTHWNPALHFIWKPVIWFVMKIKWLVSIWIATLGWNELTYKNQSLNTLWSKLESGIVCHVYTKNF